MTRTSHLSLLVLLVLAPAPTPGDDRSAQPAATRLGIRGTHFAVNGKPVFLAGVSYFAALGAPDRFLRQDLDEIRRRGFRWVRVWATWAAFGHDVSAVDRDGRPRPDYLKKLERFVAVCDRRGLVVDVTLSRGNGVTGPPRLQTLRAHRRAAETLTRALRRHANWYLDLANERNVRDRRFTPVADLRALRRAVKRIDPDRLVTASHAGDLTRAELGDYLLTARLDFVAPHRPRDARSPGRTEARSREYLAWMKDLGRSVPVHYQEPFRRGFGRWQPAAGAYAADLRGARAGGAAGWCFHTGDQRDRPDGRPRRSFDLRARRLFDQLDGVERQALKELQPLLEAESRK